MKGFEISQGMQNNQNQIMASIGALSGQLSMVESYVLSGQSQIMDQLSSVQSTMLSNQNQVMTALGGLSGQLFSVETNVSGSEQDNEPIVLGSSSDAL